MAGESVELDLQWKSCLEKPFNVLTVGKIFRFSQNCLVVGGEDGMISVFEIPLEKQKCLSTITLKKLAKLETKGGPVQTLCLNNVTKFGSVDLIVGDSKGTLTFFGNKQILNKIAVSQGCLSAVTVDIDAAQNLSIIVGDNEGNIFGCLPRCVQWRLRLSDMIKTNIGADTQPTVASLISIKLPISSTMVSNYVIVADSNNNLHVLQNGAMVKTLEMPSVVNTMCTGYFLDTPDSVNTPLSPHSSTKATISHRVQVALGMKDGQIFIMNNFNLSLYANVKLPLTNIIAYPLPDGGKTMDIILCCGYFNSLLVYHEGCLLHRVATTDWVNSITLTPSDNNHDQNILLGTLDGTILLYKMTVLLN